MGTGDNLIISFKAEVDSLSGHETRTISTPASTAELICSNVASISVVFVFVIVCTVIGASPPTKTLPTLIFLDFLRSICL